MHLLKHMHSACCSNLKRELADKDLQLKFLTANLRTTSAEIEDLKAQLQQQQTHAAELEARSQQHQAELSAQRDTMVPKEEKEQAIVLCQAWEKHAKSIQEQLNIAQAQPQPQDLAPGSDAATKAELESTKADLEACRSELAAAQQKIAALNKVKAEDSTAGQRTAEAERKVSSLEADSRRRDAELASTKQELQDAQRDFQQTSECLQSELQATQTRCQQLEVTCNQQKQGFAETVEDMLKKVDEHGAQYIKDYEWRDRKIDDLKEQLQESGKHGHKRPRDHSNGRDSKRRN